MSATIRHIGSPLGSRGGIRSVSGFGSGSADSAAYTNFIARATTLTGVYPGYYKTLLDGLTTDGLFNSDGTSNYFDILFVLATQDATNAVLSLVNGTFSITSVLNSPTFTADRGYTGNGSNALLATNFNASTATTPHYTQNAAHVSAWNLTNASDGSPIMGVPAGDQNIYPKFNGDNNIYARVNDLSSGFAITDPRGHLFANRSTSTARQVYQNSVSAGTYGSTASSAVSNSAMSGLGDGSTGFSSYQLAMFSSGGSLNGTEVTNFYNRLRTYMTAVGVP